jgi:uncharacterized cupin superfamily protein
MPRLTFDQFHKAELGPDEVCGPSQSYWISEAGGLTQFGALIEVLPPGSRSSIKHWHSAEDELVYVLAGEVTLVEGEVETLMRPGDAATFKAGVAVGHFLHNRSRAETRCLVVGTRAPVDVITYPDHGRICHRVRSEPADVWTDLAGRPASIPYAEVDER